MSVKHLSSKTNATGMIASAAALQYKTGTTYTGAVHVPV